MSWVLAISIALLGYTYAGYPVLIWALSRLRGRPIRKGPYAGGVAVLIAARNEAEALPRKLENLLELARTEPIREIWIGLDGCTDGTGAAVRSLGFEVGGPQSEVRSPANQQSTTNDQRPAIHILEFERQRGKAAVLNDLMAQAGQPIFAMMDARQRVEPGAIGRLLENFADEQVGAVSGALVYESAAGGAQKGADSYWGYEKFLRRCESRYWAVPGATGALYAIRRELCGAIPENTLVDDVLIPMRAVLKGFRCLFEPSARVFDLPSARFDQEGARKRRTLAGIWQLARLEPALFSVFANPIWFQWISHKFLRLLTPFFVVFVCFSLGFLAWKGIFLFQTLFFVFFALFSTSFLAFLGGKWISSRGLGLFGAFFGVNLALARAARDAATGRFEARWKR